MHNGLIAYHYAKALLEYASGLHQQQEVYEKMKLFLEVYGKMPELHHALTNPAITAKEKAKIVATACGGPLPSSLSKMANVIIKNEREDVLRSIAKRFIELYREKFNIRSGQLVTAVPITPTTASKIIAQIGSMVEAEVEIETLVDSSLIGGFVLFLEDNRWDASIAGRLNHMKQKLLHP